MKNSGGEFIIQLTMFIVLQFHLCWWILYISTLIQNRLCHAPQFPTLVLRGYTFPSSLAPATELFATPAVSHEESHR